MAADRTPTGLPERLAALGRAVDLSAGRADEAVVEDAAALVKRAGERFGIAGDHTVVALAGATGSGKSSVFNALSASRLARTGVRRPMTSEAMAVAWGTELPADLLDWLGVGRRHLVVSDSSAARGLVLLDLPDHDSTEVDHRLTVDRLVELVDMLVWVVDPQKYADAALHDGYLRRLTGHADVMVVVLNQIDRLTAEQVNEARADLRKLLDAEGLQRTPVLAVSALTGEGMRDLAALLERAVADKTMAGLRYSADVTRSAEALAADLGSGSVPRLTSDVVARLNDALAEAAGVPVVVEGVAQAWRHRGALATGWPMVSWLRRLKPDPLKRLRVGLSPRELSPTDVSRTSLPKVTSVQRARLDSAVRELVDDVSVGLPRGWVDAIRVAARGDDRLRTDRLLADRLDAAVASTDLRMNSGRGWWVLVTILQWVLFVALVVGALWLATPWVLALLQVPMDLPSVEWRGWPVQTLLVIGGLAGGLLLSGLSRIFVEAGARVKARAARKALTDAIGAVAASDLVAPVQAELDRLAAARDAVRQAA